jgi:hypothetical protein
MSYLTIAARELPDIYFVKLCQKGERDGTEELFYTFFCGNGNEYYQLGVIILHKRQGFKKI